MSTEPTQFGSDEVVPYLANFTDAYETHHFGPRVTSVGGDVETIATTSPEEFLQFFYHHYAFNRAGGMKAGYNDYAVTAVDETDGVDPGALWRVFKQECTDNGTGLNERVNRGAVTETAALVNEHGNLFEWVGDTIQDEESLTTVYDEIGGIQGFGEKITRFFIRDAVWLTGTEQWIPEREREYIQPMDVWTRRIACLLLDDVWEKPNTEIASDLAEICCEANVSGAEFNQGAWYFCAKEMNGDGESIVRALSPGLTA